MIDLTPTITQAQIAFFLGVIALVLVFHVFSKDVDKLNKNKKSK